MSTDHLQLKDFSPDNMQSYVAVPDEHFSRERNYQVIEGVLAENDRMQKKLHTQVEKNAGNVADILASFAKYKLDIGGGKQIEQYMGKQWMSKIYGEKLLEKIRMAEIIRAQNIARGNTFYNGYFYTN